MPGKLFGIVFEGNFLPGFDPAAARAQFADRFGAAAANRVFNQDRSVLKRDVSRADAEQIQSVLAGIGLAVTLVPVASAENGPAIPAGAESAARQREKKHGPASMIVRAGERARARATVNPPTSIPLAKQNATENTGNAQSHTDARALEKPAAPTNPLTVRPAVTSERITAGRRVRFGIVAIALAGLAALIVSALFAMPRLW